MAYLLNRSDELTDLVEFEVDGEDFVFVSLPGAEPISPNGPVDTETDNTPANPLPPQIVGRGFATSTAETETLPNANSISSHVTKATNTGEEVKADTVVNKKDLPAVEMVEIRGNIVKTATEGVGKPMISAIGETTNKARNIETVQPTTTSTIIKAGMARRTYEEEYRAMQIARAGKKIVEPTEQELWRLKGADGDNEELDEASK